MVLSEFLNKLTELLLM